MAKYRPLYIELWKDPEIQQLTSTQKLLFIYLFSNESTNESGIYPITPITMSNETGISKKKVKKYLDEQLPNICYDFKNKCVFVVNFYAYNGKGRPDLVKKAVEKENEQIVTPLWIIFKKRYVHYDYLNGYEELNKDLTKPLQTLAQGFNRIEYNSNSISISINKAVKRENIKREKKKENEEKKVYATNDTQDVRLKKKEYKKLVDKYGKGNVKSMIEKLNNYKGSKGKIYKSDYRAILNWVVDEVIDKPKEREDSIWN